AAEEGWLSRAAFPDSKSLGQDAALACTLTDAYTPAGFGEEPDPHDLMRSLPALRHGKNVMKIHLLWILFWLYVCDLAQSQTCMIRVLKVEGDKTVDSPLLLDGSKDVLVSIGRGITIQGTAIKPVSDPVTGRDTAKELSVAFGSDEATARTRPMSHGDLWFL